MGLNGVESCCLFLLCNLPTTGGTFKLKHQRPMMEFVGHILDAIPGSNDAIPNPSTSFSSFYDLSCDLIHEDDDDDDDEGSRAFRVLGLLGF